MEKINPRAALLNDVSQHQVDFVIPRIGVDIQLGIDPFLMFKSRDEELSHLHTLILQTFNYGIDLIKKNKINDARNLFDFPEVAEIGLGYTQKSKRGAGVGDYLSELIIETLLDSPLLLERGVRHIEEMQLVSLGIGPDRVSDISGNLLKYYLIQYTQKQCEIWNIPLVKGTPISHFFDFESFCWRDDYFDLPVSPIDQTPLILVPRRIVRALPWINYDDYFKLEFTAFLHAKRVRNRLKTLKQTTNFVNGKFQKSEVVALSRKEIMRIDRYIQIKEDSAEKAQPSTNYLDESNTLQDVTDLQTRLMNLTAGRAKSFEYQRLILEIFNYLFEPELIDGELEVRTIDGTERRDIVYTNDSDQSFWAYLRDHHSSVLLMLETKNVDKVNFSHINQVAAYLGDRMGLIGFIVTRKPCGIDQTRKIYSIYNDSSPRKIILVISDQDIFQMLNIKNKGENPMKYIQKMYRTFLTKVQ